MPTAAVLVRSGELSGHRSRIARPSRCPHLLLGSRRPGIERVRAALPRCDARHESPGETVTAWVLHHLGYPTGPQLVVPGTEAFTPCGRGYRADLGIVGTRVLVEFDGRSKYASGQDLWDEERREDRIRALSWEVVRLTWADLQHPERVRVLVEAAVRRTAARRLPMGHGA